MSRHRRLITIFLLVNCAFFGPALFDLIREGALFEPAEVAVELADSLILVGAMAAVARAVHGVSDLREMQEALANNLSRNLAKGERWRLSRQTEIDIAGLMPKGASPKEIALARDTSAATIRQQAQSVYRKSGLSGRAGLSAYFLENLIATAEDQRQHKAALTVVASGG